MKHRIALILLIVLVTGCSAEPAMVPTASPPPTMTSSPVPSTATVTPSPIPPTETLIPSPTPLPGKLVLPIDTLGKSIPWLPMPGPGVALIGFNTLRPPFNSALVRQAFAYAVDRQVITDMAQKYKASNPTPAQQFSIWQRGGDARDRKKKPELIEMQTKYAGNA